MNKKRILEPLLPAFDYAISSGEPEECARQFMVWMDRVASALYVAQMADEHQAWKQAQDSVYFFSEDNSFPAQAESMKALLIGIIEKADGENSFIDDKRIDQLRALASSEYDLTRLIRLCEELNLCYSNDCLFATVALTRTILLHVPPVFGYKDFAEVANNYGGGKSFKRQMQHLDQSAREIANTHLHSQVQQSESLPNRVQVNFSNDLDVLLLAILKILNNPAH